MAAVNDNKLGDLKGRHPGWRIWRGQTTGDARAMPPPGHPLRRLLSAQDADALGAKLAEITSWDSGEHP